MSRMRDIAGLAGVSVTTVSHVVNNTRRVAPATRLRVLEAIAATGYQHNTIARALARGGSRSIGLALSALSNPYLADIVTAIERRVKAHGSMVLLGETHENAEQEYDLVDTFLVRSVDGVILAPGPRSLARTLPALLESGVPTVLIDRLMAPGAFDQVGSENRQAVASIVDHLAAHGHQRIALISGLSGLPTTVERQHGYAIGLMRSGLPFRRALVADGGSHGVAAARAMSKLWSLSPRPTAVIAANNFMTVGVLKYLAAQRIDVPGDIAVAGYDDFEWAELMSTPITAVAQDWATIGADAVEMLFARIADPDREPRSHRVPAKLIVRRSCGCPARTADVASRAS